MLRFFPPQARMAWLLAIALLAPRIDATAANAEWNFSVQLDGRNIGTHRFALVDKDGARELLSEARFEVKLLGFTAYRYAHRATELWDNDCLASIEAETNDDGLLATVTGKRLESGFAISSRIGKRPATDSAPGCLMSFAYWNPALATQQRLLDPGTGRIESVTITALQTTTIPVRGNPASVRGLRIAGLQRPIDLWYLDKDWVGLDTTVRGGRKLSYRLP
jgi:hypothetical protein